MKALVHLSRLRLFRQRDAIRPPNLSDVVSWQWRWFSISDSSLICYEDKDWARRGTRLGYRARVQAQRHQLFDKWAGRVLALHEVKKLLNEVGVLKAIIRMRLISIEKNPVNREFLRSRWSTETHTSIVAYGKFSLPLEVLAMLMSLPSFGKVHTTGVTLKGKIRRRSSIWPSPCRALSTRWTMPFISHGRSTLM